MSLTGAQSPDPQGIEVDLRGLLEFANQFGAEVSAELNPDADRIITEYAQGVPFGRRSASPEVQSAAREYHTSLVTAIEALRSYATVAEELIRAARRIAAEYGASDDSAAARAEGVTRTEAVPQ